jgi:hypothetical protein
LEQRGWPQHREESGNDLLLLLERRTMLPPVMFTISLGREEKRGERSGLDDSLLGFVDER